MTTETSPHRPPCTEGDHCGELHCPLPVPRRRLTELEHDAAGHAIEGVAGQEGADPDTVLNAVLRALDIDPPASAPTLAAAFLARVQEYDIRTDRNIGSAESINKAKACASAAEAFAKEAGLNEGYDGRGLREAAEAAVRRAAEGAGA